MENEIMYEEEIMETEEVATSNTSKAVTFALIGAAIIGGGVLLHKKVVKPLIEKYKAKKAIEADAEVFEDCDEE